MDITVQLKSVHQISKMPSSESLVDIRNPALGQIADGLFLR